MPPKLQIDDASLMKAIADGIPQKEILSRFRFKTPGQLKVAYLHALTRAGKVTALKFGRLSTSDAEDTKIAVNKRGSLIIPKAMAEQFGLQTGDIFDVTKTNAGLALYSRRRPKH